jgi:ATP-binding cassette subfamily B protein
MNTWDFTRHLIRRAPLLYTMHFLCYTAFIALPVVLGVIQQRFFDTLSGTAPAGSSLWTLPALFVSVGVARLILSFITTWGDITFRFSVGAVLRLNLLAGALRRPGALPAPIDAGAAISRYRQDVDEVSDFPIWLPDAAGHILSAGTAIVIMARIDPAMTVVIVLPLIALFGLARIGWSRLIAYYEAAAAAGDRVNAFLGEIFGAIQAIKVAGAEGSVTQHLGTLNEVRRRLKVREEILRELLFNITDNLVVFGVAIVLIMAGEGLRTGSFSVGDFALFNAYLWLATGLPAYLGTFLGDYRQQAAAIRRLSELVPDEPVRVLVESDDLGALTPQLVSPPVGAETSRSDGGVNQVPLLELRNISFRHPGSDRGIEAIDLRIVRGTLTVITGPVGAGKTTLLRVMLGLLPAQGGTIVWKGIPVEDPAAFFRPPRSAYTPQAARLFSETLLENIRLGLPAAEEEVRRALQTAVFAPDLAAMPEGLATLIGPRGLRLSGGQIQRVAAARMLVRRPELLVCDDLSSALDVETEAQLWAGLLNHPAQHQTIIAVSHRPALLQRADQVITLNTGRIAGMTSSRCNTL